jgi:hypothetical protein
MGAEGRERKAGIGDKEKRDMKQEESSGISKKKNSVGKERKKGGTEEDD